MRENNENFQKETDIMFALASILLNVLILVVLCGSVWMLHSYFAQISSHNLFLPDYTVFR